MVICKNLWSSGKGAREWRFLLFAVAVLILAKALDLPVSSDSKASGMAATPRLLFWSASGLTRIGPTDAPEPSGPIRIFAARGEVADAQVVVRASGSALTKVNLAVSELRGPNDAVIPRSAIALYREYYLRVKGTGGYRGGSNPPLGSGVYPEPLIPFNDPEGDAPLCESKAILKACNATVSAGKNQPYWIDVSVPRGASNSPPGDYLGKITVSSEQGTDTVPIVLTVWNFELPAQSSELSLFTLWPPNSGDTLSTLNRALMRNKVMGWYDTTSEAASDTAVFGLSRSALQFTSPVDIRCDGTALNLPSVNQINAAALGFPSGIGLDIYIGDELNGCPRAYASLKRIASEAHAANFNVKTLLTINSPDRNLLDEGDGRSAIDHWVLLDSVEQWPALPFTGGGDLWSYTSCNLGFGNAPEWLVDYPPINERIQAGFLNWTQGAAGILYYRADGWIRGDTAESWNEVDTTACGGSLARPGDGIFLYPPSPIGSSEPAPGIRLKAIRDGLQDYQYAQELKRQRQESFVNAVLDPIAASWAQWSDDPKRLESARQQLGERLNQIASAGASASTTR
jgi:hypothetical protein